MSRPDRGGERALVAAASGLPGGGARARGEGEGLAELVEELERRRSKRGLP